MFKVEFKPIEGVAIANKDMCCNLLERYDFIKSNLSFRYDQHTPELLNISAVSKYPFTAVYQYLKLIENYIVGGAKYVITAEDGVVIGIIRLLPSKVVTTLKDSTPRVLKSRVVIEYMVQRTKDILL